MINQKSKSLDSRSNFSGSIVGAIDFESYENSEVAELVADELEEGARAVDAAWSSHSRLERVVERHVTDLHQVRGFHS